MNKSIANTKKKLPLIENRKARFRFEITETLEAGIVLTGSEVKSLRQGRAKLIDAYGVVQNGELFLLNLRIEPYENAASFPHQKDRTRKLLVKKEQINRLRGAIQEKRYTLIALKLYFNEKGRVKVLMGVGRGKTQADKRETERKADAQRDIERALRRNY